MLRGILEKEQARYLLVGIACANLIVLSIYACIPLWDSIFYALSTIGGTTFFGFSFFWWIIWVTFIFNFLMVIALFATVADAKHKTRADFHFILTYGALIMNVICVVVCAVWFLFFTNKSYSGTQPTNDPMWCCLYYAIHPDLCPNTNPCVSLPNLSVNGSFELIFIFSGVFLVFNFFHIGLNRMLHTSKIIVETSDVSEERFSGLFLGWIYLSLFIYWAAFPLWDTIFGPGYQLYQWWFVWLLTFNLAPPLLFFILITKRESYTLYYIFFYSTIVISLISAISLCVFLFILIFNCNNWLFFFNSAGSICNDPLYCCQHFADAPFSCPNITPCPYVPTLHVDSAFVQHMIFSLLFGFLATALCWMSYRLKNYGFFAWK